MRRTLGLAVLLLFASGLAGCSGDPPEDAVETFLSGWQAGKLTDVGFVAADGSRVAADQVLSNLRQLYGDLDQAPLAVTRAGDSKTTGDHASTPIDVKWTLPGGVGWAYQSTVRATKARSDGWQVIWEPALLHPQLEAGDKLRLRREAPERATVQDAAGKPLVSPTRVVTVGVHPQEVRNLADLQKKLAAGFRKIDVEVDMRGLKDRVAAADPGAFLDLVTLRWTDYSKIRSEIRPLKGASFQEGTRQLAPTRTFARALLGTVDQATKEDIENNPGTLVAGDLVGHGGVQEKYDQVLRGTSGVSVLIAREAADGEVDATPVFTAAPVAGKPVKISIDLGTQNAADQALAAEKRPSSLVAIRISDGSVLAVANGPDAGGVNTALTGQVPPGSTYKAISAYGLLAGGAVQTDTVVDCPKTFTVDGREFKNSHDQALGKVPFHVNFAKSCNTAFAALAPKLGSAGLQDASKALGIGATWDLGVEAFTGQVSDGGTATELAAATFGQGSTIVSPMAMAAATAAIAKGRFQPPKLVLEPAPAQPGEPGPELDQGAVTALREMMREVVTDGTATALRPAAGKPVHGKTGTAEFQTGSEQTHSWFIGYQGDVAFAVMVQKAGAGSEAAVPAAKRFLTGLNK